MIKFIVEGRPISLNVIYSSHWHKRNEDKKEWEWRVRAGLLKYKVAKDPLSGAVQIDFIAHVLRPIDVDNVAGTAKIIIDGLRSWGTLAQDSPTWVKKICIEVVAKDPKEYIEVTII